MIKTFLFSTPMLVISFCAHANIETRCLDVKIGKNANYSNCKILTPSQRQLAAEEEREAVIQFNAMKKHIDRSVIQEWRPPMGFSGYSVKVSYLISPSGTLQNIEFDDYHTHSELKQSLLAAMQSVRGAYIPNNALLEKQLKTTRVTSTYYVR